MTNEKHLVAAEGLVYCSVRGTMVDLERCLGCRRLIEYDLDARRPYVVCRGPEDDRSDRPRRVSGPESVRSPRPAD